MSRTEPTIRAIVKEAFKIYICHIAYIGRTKTESNRKEILYIGETGEFT